MAYIPGFTYDIFISYAHLDNEKMPGKDKGWIELFYQSLNLKLAQRIGKMDVVKIWWDSKKLDGSKLFDNTIEDGIRNSALMISLISPGYLNSEYCKLEMDLFYKKLVGDKIGKSIGDNSRMIKVLLNNIPHHEIPEQFGRSTGFPFYKAQDSDDFGEPLDFTDPVFSNQLKELRDSIVSIFEAFPKEQIESNVDPSSNLKNDSGDNVSKRNFTIYFGDVADSLRTARKRTIKDLEKNGFEIITDIPPPLEAQAHDQKVTEELKKADLAIHLLDQYPGREIEDTDTWFPKKQTELSLQFSKSKLIWMPDDLDENEIEEEVYKTFLQNLAKNNNPENKFEFIRGSKSELTQQITDYAETINQSKSRIEKNKKIAVLLDTHFSDQEYAFGLGQALLQNNMQPYINPQEDDPSKNINMLADRISQVNKLVFLYGNVSREWVLGRVSAALQLIITNSYPIDDFYIYMAPPNKTNDDIQLNQRFLKINVLNNSSLQRSSTEMLDTFIKNMRDGGLS